MPTRRKTAVKTPDDDLIPQPHGGALLSSGRQGNKGGSGRPPKLIRAKCAAAFEARIHVAEQLAEDVSVRAQDRIAALALLARLGGLNDLYFDPEAIEENREEQRRLSKLLRFDSDM
jgi:hypothetical protein